MAWRDLIGREVATRRVAGIMAAEKAVGYAWDGFVFADRMEEKNVAHAMVLALHVMHAVGLGGLVPNARQEEKWKTWAGGNCMQVGPQGPFQFFPRRSNNYGFCFFESHTGAGVEGGGGWPDRSRGLAGCGPSRWASRLGDSSGHRGRSGSVAPRLQGSSPRHGR
jgi:hypothetical protein